jgi:hypothetical protein
LAICGSKELPRYRLIKSKQLKERNMAARNKNDRQTPHQFSRRTNPRETSRIPLCDRDATVCRSDHDAMHIEERHELRDRSFKAQEPLQVFLVRIIVCPGMREVLRKIYAVAELTQEELARRLREDPARICVGLKQYRAQIRKFAFEHPEWIAELSPPHQRMILGRDYRKDGLDW